MAGFDLKTELDEYPMPEMLKAGFEFYINQKKIKINSKKDFEKVLKEYKTLKIGG